MRAAYLVTILGAGLTLLCSQAAASDQHVHDVPQAPGICCGTKADCAARKEEPQAEAPGAKACCEEPAPDPAGQESAAAGLASLAEGLAPLVADFNGAAGRSRFLAILSPTCPACLHGADAIREAVLTADPSPEVFIVWAPMLGADDAAAASASAADLVAPRVHQYWDPRRLAGLAFRHDVFPDAAARMKSSVPPGHFFAPYLDSRDPNRPEWDIYMLFDSSTRWNGSAPAPGHWVRQVARFASSTDKGLVSLMWMDSYGNPPVEGSLAERLGEILGTPGRRSARNRQGGQARP